MIATSSQPHGPDRASQRLIAGVPDVVSASGAAPFERSPEGDVPSAPHPAGVPGSSAGEPMPALPLSQSPVAPAVNQFMGSMDFPLTPEEYVKRYKPQDVPHVFISNPSRSDSLRVDLIAERGGVFVSVLLPSRAGCYFPTLDKGAFRVVPNAYVHAAAP